MPGDGLESGRRAPSIGIRVAVAARGYAVELLVSPEPVHVLVLYNHPLMGEGLERMLAAEPGVVVHAVDIAEPAALDDALADEPAVIVVEEGGALDAVDVVRRSSCAVVLDVDINTTRAWTLRRESLSSRPEEFLAAVRAVVGGVARREGSEPPRPTDTERAPATESPSEPDPRSEAGRTRRPAVVPG